MKPRIVTFRARLALWYAGTLALLLLVFAVEVHVLVRTSLLRQLDDTLASDLDAVALLLDRDARDLSRLAEAQALPYIAVSVAPDRPPFETKLWAQAGLSGAFEPTYPIQPRLWTSSTGDTFRVRVRRLDGGRWVAAAREANDARVALQALTLTLAIGLPSTLLLALVGGHVLAGRALRPVGEMAEQARQITADRLDARLDIPNPRDEFGALATIFNETLGRLERSFGQLRRFTSDASHQLRTPLAAIRAVGEVALRESRSKEELAEALGSVLEETERLSRLVEDLLTLTRAEGGQITARREQTDLAALAQELHALFEALAEERDIALALDAPDPALVHTDRALLHQAAANLVDNALKYTPAGGRVTLRVRANEFAVDDTGLGIPAAERDRVFERFHRGADAAGTRGTGLGLPIAKWAAEVAGGALVLEDGERGGARFVIRFHTTEVRP